MRISMWILSERLRKYSRSVQIEDGKIIRDSGKVREEE